METDTESRPDREGGAGGGRIAVVGPGAVGGLVAAFLQQAGHDVVMVAREHTARSVTEHGLDVVTDRYGSWHAPLPASTSVPPGALVLVTVKAAGVPDVARQVADSRPREVLSLLNGVEHMDELRGAFGAPTSDGGTPVVGASYAGETLRTRAGDGGPWQVRHRGELLRITVPAEGADLAVVAALRDTQIPVADGGREVEVLWSKLRFLAPLALLTSIHGTGIGPGLARDPGLTDALLGEVAAVASAEGVPTSGDDLRGILAGLPATMRSSLQADLAEGRVGELDAIGGAVARRGVRHGVAAPALEDIVSRLRAEVA
ncbi:ketopantoate reductase family protein [Isoptericola aurantiacus]|uniref:ketopantoate reductase family protein n=1 Tax=Isoptericola aurantiacus TaxID=3377839 RepID=UPI003839F323